MFCLELNYRMHSTSGEVKQKNKIEKNQQGAGLLRHSFALSDEQV